MGNGSEASGDGWRYRGRGFIQLTGKSNYKAVAEFLKELGVEKWDIVSNPDYVSNDPEIGALAAIGYIMRCRDGNAVIKAANAHDVVALTRSINGRLNGLDHRKKFTRKFLEILNNYNSQNPNSDIA
jgi:putative chitinase